MSRQSRTVKENLESLTVVLKQKLGTQKRASDEGITKVLGVSEMGQESTKIKLDDSTN